VKFKNFIGLVLSLIYALIEVVPIADAQKLQSCWDTWNIWIDRIDDMNYDGDLFSCYFFFW
jgi:hypothetical protein